MKYAHKEEAKCGLTCFSMLTQNYSLTNECFVDFANVGYNFSKYKRDSPETQRPSISEWDL